MEQLLRKTIFSLEKRNCNVHYVVVAAFLELSVLTGFNTWQSVKLRNCVVQFETIKTIYYHQNDIIVHPSFFLPQQRLEEKEGSSTGKQRKACFCGFGSRLCKLRGEVFLSNARNKFARNITLNLTSFLYGRRLYFCLDSSHFIMFTCVSLKKNPMAHEGEGGFLQYMSGLDRPVWF